MTAEDILQQLKSAGVEVTALGESIKVRAHKAVLTEAQKSLITDNRALILLYLNTSQSKAEISTGENVDNNEGDIYKTYKYPNGEDLKLTREEFDNVVDVFRMLLEQDTLLYKQGKGFT